MGDQKAIGLVNRFRCWEVGTAQLQKLCNRDSYSSQLVHLFICYSVTYYIRPYINLKF